MTAEEIYSKLKKCGVDESVVRERFMGNKGIYVKVLRVLKEDTSFSDLREALLARDYGRAFESAHTLKGIAGNLGFGKVLENLLPLVELLRDQEDAKGKEAEIEGYMEKLKDDYGEVEKVLEEVE